VHRKTVAFVDLNAICENYSLACRLAPESKNIAVIKADAYGHGMLRVAQALQAVVPAFAVAILEEALELRAAGISQPILVLEGVNDAEACEAAAANELSLVVHNQEQVSQLFKTNLSGDVPLWLKVDTGMHRIGFAPDDLKPALEKLQAGGHDVSVICTHLACADELARDATKLQLDIFKTCVAGIDLPTSISNSAGILAWPASHADWNRPGYLLYGNSPMTTDVESARGLQPAMTLRSEIIAIREVPAGESVGYGARWTAQRPSVVGTVAAGYADGYPRHAANGTPTMVNGQIAPLVGMVSMDMLSIDLTDHERAAIGDTVELWGQQVNVNEVARHCGTIGYELLTNITPRVPRTYTPLP
jgi:alanine racemase